MENHRQYLPTYDECFICGQHHPRGLRVRFYTRSDGNGGNNGHVYADFTPDHTQTGYLDIVHGGVISALFDELTGWPAALATGKMAFTAELNVRYIRPVKVGKTYLATAYPTIDKGRFWEGKSDLRDAEGTIYARANGKYFMIPEQDSAVMADLMTYAPGDLPVFQPEYLKE
ncbi:MAG: PaaI family thioesterase [Anaerolineae bacterium]|nr:PaaI family thioesterase [Anaerolineae bacterium]